MGVGAQRARARALRRLCRSSGELWRRPERSGTCCAPEDAELPNRFFCPAWAIAHSTFVSPSLFLGLLVELLFGPGWLGLVLSLLAIGESIHAETDRPLAAPPSVPVLSSPRPCPFVSQARENPNPAIPNQTRNPNSQLPRSFRARAPARASPPNSFLFPS